MYDVAPYFLSKTIVEFPYLTLMPFLILLPTYWSVGFIHGAYNFFMFYLALMLEAQYSASFGYLVSCTFSSMEAATMIAPVIAMPLTMFSGFYANVDSIPTWIAWIQWLSPLRYTFECLVTVEFPYEKTAPFDIPELLGFNLGYWNCIYCLIGLTIIVRIIAMFVLKSQVGGFQ